MKNFKIYKCLLTLDFSCVLFFVSSCCYRLQRSWDKVMFLQASVILSTGGLGGVCLSACWDTPLEQTPLGADTSLGADTPQEQTPPGADTPYEQTPPRADTHQSRHPPRRACWEIRSTRGRYASYWNATCYIIF